MSPKQRNRQDEFAPAESAGPLAACREELSRVRRHDIGYQILPLVFHKLKNKLTPILGYAQILSAKYTDDFLRERLKKIEANAAELSELMNTLKDHFRFADSRREEIHIHTVIERLQPELRAIGEREGISILLQLDPAVPRDRLDPDQIEVLVRLLVENAVRALRLKEGSGRHIRISTRCRDSGYDLLVYDNGMGIATEDQPLVWTPFFHKFTDSTGLGLTLCEQIATVHGASTGLSSQPGEYAEFRISFRTDKNTPSPRIQEE